MICKKQSLDPGQVATKSDYAFVVKSTDSAAKEPGLHILLDI